MYYDCVIMGMALSLCWACAIAFRMGSCGMLVEDAFRASVWESGGLLVCFGVSVRPSILRLLVVWMCFDRSLLVGSC